MKYVEIINIGYQAKITPHWRFILQSVQVLRGQTPRAHVMELLVHAKVCYFKFLISPTSLWSPIYFTVKFLIYSVKLVKRKQKLFMGINTLNYCFVVISWATPLYHCTRVVVVVRPALFNLQSVTGPFVDAQIRSIRLILLSVIYFYTLISLAVRLVQKLTFWLLTTAFRVRSPASTSEIVCGYQVWQVGFLPAVQFLSV